MRNGGREQEITGEKRDRGGQWDASIVDLVEIRKDVLPKTG